LKGAECGAWAHYIRMRREKEKNIEIEEEERTITKWYYDHFILFIYQEKLFYHNSFSSICGAARGAEAKKRLLH
jgi:hypothetical protein